MFDFKDNPSPAELARQRTILRVVIVAFIVMAAIVLFALPQLPLAARIFIAATDLILAAVIWLVLRQKFSGK